MYSLRRTLAVRFSLTLFVALLLIALWAYLGAQRILREELDRGLAAAAELEAAVLASGYPLPPHHGPADLPDFVASVNRFVAVRDVPGAVVAANTPWAEHLPLDRASYERALAGEPAWATESWGGGEIRSLYMPAPRADGRGYAVVQLAASLGPLRAANRELLFLMLGTLLLSTLAAAMGAGWLADATVAPVIEITKQAEAVRAGQRGQRITAHGDVDELAGLVRVLNGMLERLEDAYVAQRRLIADAGHDLRTPLTAMRSEVELALRSERAVDDYRRHLASLLEEVEHLTRISDALILLARLDAGELVPLRQAADLVELTEHAVHNAEARAGGRSFRLAVERRPLVAPVDARMIAVVLDQLLDNCIRHTPADTCVEVRLHGNGTPVGFTVEDDGPGLPAAALEHLFERFFRGDAARTRLGGGAGLGLSVASAIIAAHGGTIRAEPSRLGGLRIAVELPVAD